ncbi:PQQ-dependent dehydrogenase, methanol/ethanol family [Methylomonas sp. LL1]|uniref:PQQ-dependent dehydrogenase, methanol/ethanol family n=1 Tax=Methylomonas sp. LL1 TaxID=2785785 RepID=UPI0018C40489|nr:PQQ-dependent dehydrogenase, methanol/ethanol family [Methylomonas sp. LL1]QPK61729.1 PQQ-dependent dehydrogenase, methanol/ethanol family [Methylomonas sp. LL1]
MTVTNILYFNKEPLPGSNARPTQIHKGVMLALLIGGSAFSVGTVSAAGAGAEWTTAGGTPEGTRYSELAEITPANAAQLKEEFSFKTGAHGSHMGEPLVVGNTLYVVTPFPNKLIAYDLTKGQTKWTYAPQVSEYAKGANCCGGINRGAAYADGKIVFNLLDNTTVAVDAITGKEVWRNHMADPHTGVTMTVAPVIAKDKVITASSSGEMGVRGWIQALDLKTGKSLWRAYNTGPDKDVLIGQNFRDNSVYYKDQVDQGASSWPNQRAYLLGGSAAWGYLTYDPELDLLFYGTSQPGVWNAEMRCEKSEYEKNPRKCDNKWGASIFARKPDTGEAIWAYQFVPHDSWDYDAASENIAVNQTITVRGVTHDKLLVHFNKNGFAYTFDRATGEVLLAPQFVEDVNWANGVDLTTGLPDVNDDMRVHQGELTENICPSVLGGKGWEPASFSPKTGLFYAPTFNLCSNLEALKAEFISGSPYMGTDYSIGAAKDKSYASELIAWDAANGKKKWGVKESAWIYAGTLTTAGGVVFYSTKEPLLKAVDANTGEPVFSTKLECNTVGNPISFAGPDGKQRIAVFSDDKCAANAGSGDDDHQSGNGGWVHVYKLP